MEIIVLAMGIYIGSHLTKKNLFFKNNIENSLGTLQDAVDGPFKHHYEAKTIILSIDDKIYMKLNLNSLVLLTTQIILRLGGFGRE